MTLRDRMVKDLVNIETQIGSPKFTWNGDNYNIIPSITDFKKELDTGGFQVIRMLTATVRKLDLEGNPIFSTYPLPQEIISYADGQQYTNYRIEAIRHDPTGAYFRMVAHSTTKMK